jgi:hypothetical protein
MRRREFVKRVGLGSAAIGSAVGTAVAAPKSHGQEHVHDQVDGPLAAATVSFGAWPASGVNRVNTPNAPQAANVHLQFPYVAKIKAGGAVNFIIAGFHQVVVYAPGTQLSDISTAVLTPLPPPTPPQFGLIDDPNNRVYRGISPGGLPQDRVEVVRFPDPGLFLVICAFSPHFINDKMHGWVNVLP